MVRQYRHLVLLLVYANYSNEFFVVIHRKFILPCMIFLLPILEPNLSLNLRSISRMSLNHKIKKNRITQALHHQNSHLDASTSNQQILILIKLPKNRIRHISTPHTLLILLHLLLLLLELQCCVLKVQ